MCLRTWSKGSMGLVLAALCVGPGLMTACSWSVTVRPDEVERTLEALAAENEEMASQISEQATWIAHLATRVGAPVPTGPWIMVPTLTPYWLDESTAPILGYVEIEGGRCCIGGAAGTTVDVRVSFWAASSFGEVTEMRVRTGGTWFTEAEMADAPWEPYVEGRIYPVSVAINWTGFYVSVQYLDDLGNVSSVFTDDISVEGMHSPTLTPFPPPDG